MAPTKRVRGCDVGPSPIRTRTRPAHRPAGSAWRRLVRDGRVYVAEPSSAGVLVTVLAAGEGGVRRLLLGGVQWPAGGEEALGLAQFLLEDATGQTPPWCRVEAFATDVLSSMAGDRLVVTSLDLCCWAVVHAVLDED